MNLEMFYCMGAIIHSTINQTFASNSKRLRDGGTCILFKLFKCGELDARFRSKRSHKLIKSTKHGKHVSCAIQINSIESGFDSIASHILTMRSRNLFIHLLNFQWDRSFYSFWFSITKQFLDYSLEIIFI